MIEFAGISGWIVLALAAGSAAVLAALHLLRIRPRRQRVVTTLFYQPAAERAIARRLPGRFRHPRTYALLALIGLLLALALGQPQWRADGRDGPARLVVLDAGMSMAATDGESSRWEAARAAAWREALRGGAVDVALLVADPWPRLVQAFDDSPLLLPRRLETLRPAGVPADRAAAVRLAQNLVAAGQEAEIVLITDRPLQADERSDLAGGSRAADAAQSAAGVTLRTVQVGAAGDNAGLLAAIFESPSDDPARGRLVVRVGYWGAAPREIVLIAALPDGTTLGRETRVIAADSTVEFAFDDLAADGTTVRLELGTEDALAADNRIEVTLPYRPPIRVRLDETVPRALRAIVASAPGVRGIERDSNAAGIDVRVGPLAGGIAGPALVVAAGGPALDPSAAVRIAGDDPLMRDLSFDGATCGSGVALTLRDGEAALLSAGDACVAARGVSGGQAVFRISPALVAEDAPAARHPALAAFLIRALRQLAGWTSVVALDAGRTVQDPLWSSRADVGITIAMPGSRSASALRAASAAADRASNVGGWRWSPSPFEVLLCIALVALLVEGVLHARGRIP